MEIKDSRIDAGKAFDWGRTSKEYARYRDIYPEKFYRKVIDRGLCVKGQRVLDLGTGTGVLPRNLYSYGAEWTGTDISPEQIEQAKILSEAADMKIDFQVVPAEEISFPPKTETVLPEESFQTESPDELLEHYIEKRFRENGAEVHAAG